MSHKFKKEPFMNTIGYPVMSTSFRNMKTVSGGRVAAMSNKIYGCENCNHMEAHSVAKANLKDDEKLPKTGDVCPRCTAKTLRLFDSQAEFGRAQELKSLQKQGIISDLEYQVPFKLHAPDFETGEPTFLYKYISDFCYFEQTTDENGETKSDFIVEDVKGAVITDVAKMKLKHMEAEYKINVRIVQR